MAKVENIVSIKEAGGDLEQIAMIIEHTDPSFTVYSGDDSLTLPVLAIGGNGVVSVASHIVGEKMKEMIQTFLAGDYKHAAAIHRKLLPIMKGLFLAPNPTCVKYALKLIGIDVGSVRLPLVDLTRKEQEQLKEIVNRIKN